MALSKPVIPDTDEAVYGQHFLVCGTEDCERNCQFYCNPCHRPMCEQCIDEHQKNQDTKNHEVVPYRQRKRQLPVEKCIDHPTKDIDMFCEDCQVPVCSKCATHYHQKHELNDLETIYSEKFTFCLEEIFKIHQYFLPTSRNMQEDIKGDFKDLKTTMNKIRTSMKTKAESLKNLIDTITLENIEQVNEMEERLLANIQDQAKIYQDYISYLEDLVKDFNGYLSFTKVKNNPILFSNFEHQNIQLIPKTTKPVLPVFSAGLYSKEGITELLGRVTFPDTKPENREIKPMETASTQLKPTVKQRKQDREKSDVKQTLSLCSSVTKVREYTVPGVDSVYHVSLGKLGILWVSDNKGSLVQTDLQGNQLKKIQTSGGFGYHTVTPDGGLIYTDIKNKVIKRMKQDKTITEFIKTGDWAPISVHSSHINGDILVGMIKDREAKVTRYNKSGEEIQNIQRDNKGQALYGNPHYITENINGDICTSDSCKQAVVVVNKSGQHRLSYTGQSLQYCPWGICTDYVGHILVCSPRKSLSYFISKIHVLDQDGQFLSELLTSEYGIGCPLSLCVDDESNLHEGHLINTVTVYKYLQ